MQQSEEQKPQVHSDTGGVEVQLSSLLLKLCLDMT